MKNKEKAVERPALASPTIINLPQPPVRNAEEYLKAYVGYIYTAVSAIAQEVASIDLHLYEIKYSKTGKPKTQEIFEHESLSVLHYVNQLATFYEAVEATQIYLELTGEAFWVVLKEGDTPKEFWLLRPDWVKVIPSEKDVIAHYNYYAGGVITEVVKIPKENMIPFKYFNPVNPYRGKGATQAAALPFDILNFAQEYNRNFFFNSAIPSMVFSTDQKITEQTVKRFMNQWQSSFGGRSKSNKIAFLGNGMKLDKASFGAKELDFTEQMKMMRDDVLAVFKVPKTVLGLTEDVNKANATATTRAFMERVITPRMRRFVETLNEFYLPMFIGDDKMLFLDFTDPSPEDVEMKLKRYESGRKYAWLTPNEIRAEENLEPINGGDDLFTKVESGKPEDENGDKTPEDDEGTTKPTGDEEPKGIRASIIKMLGGEVKGEKIYVPPSYLNNKPVKHMVNIPYKKPEELRKEQLEKAFVKPLKKFIGQLLATDEYSQLKDKKEKPTDKEKELAEIIRESLKGKKKDEDEKPKEDDKPRDSGWTLEAKEAYWKQFIQNITEREKKIKERSIEIFKEQETFVLIQLEDQMKSWRKRLGRKATPASVTPSLDELKLMWSTLADILREIYIEQGNYVMDFLAVGGDINITTEFASQYLVEYGGQLITEINETTRDQLMRELSIGFDAGEGIPKLSKRIREVFATATKVRADMIARTESIKASNAASVEAYRQSGVVEAKEWLAELDHRTCPFCQELDGKVISLDINYFNIGDSLTVGDQTMTFDYTDIGEPPAHVGCRCTTIPVLKGS